MLFSVFKYCAILEQLEINYPQIGKGRGLQLQHNTFKLNTEPLLIPHCEGLGKTKETGGKSVTTTLQKMAE